MLKKSLETDLALCDTYDELICDLEKTVVRQARVHDPQTLLRLNTVPGIGEILSLTLLSEIHDIRRFASVQRFASYARLVKCEKSSAGKENRRLSLDTCRVQSPDSAPDAEIKSEADDRA